jgi:hypothetical protein
MRTNIRRLHGAISKQMIIKPDATTDNRLMFFYKPTPAARIDGPYALNRND